MPEPITMTALALGGAAMGAGSFMMGVYNSFFKRPKMQFVTRDIRILNVTSAALPIKIAYKTNLVTGWAEHSWTGELLADDTYSIQPRDGNSEVIHASELAFAFVRKDGTHSPPMKFVVNTQPYLQEDRSEYLLYVTNEFHIQLANPGVDAVNVPIRYRIGKAWERASVRLGAGETRIVTMSDGGHVVCNAFQLDFGRDKYGPEVTHPPYVLGSAKGVPKKFAVLAADVTPYVQRSRRLQIRNTLPTERSVRVSYKTGAGDWKHNTWALKPMDFLYLEDRGEVVHATEASIRLVEPDGKVSSPRDYVVNAQPYISAEPWNYTIELGTGPARLVLVYPAKAGSLAYRVKVRHRTLGGEWEVTSLLVYRGMESPVEVDGAPVTCTEYQIAIEDDAFGPTTSVPANSETHRHDITADLARAVA